MPFPIEAAKMSSPSNTSLLPEPLPETTSPQAKIHVDSSASFSQPRLPPLKNAGDSPGTATMTSSLTPLGALSAARRPGVLQSSLSHARTGTLPQDMQAKMRAFHLSRQGAPPIQTTQIPLEGPLNDALVAQLSTSASPVPSGAIGVTSTQSPGASFPTGTVALNLAPCGRPGAPNFNSAPAVPHVTINPKMGLAAKRGLNRGMKLSDASGQQKLSDPSNNPETAPQNSNGVGAASTNADSQHSNNAISGSLFNRFSEFVDTKTGTLKFKGKATIHGKGIDFSSGTSFSISLDEVDNLEELGKGNYGTVYKVRHSRPQLRRPGLGPNNQKHSLPQGVPSIRELSDANTISTPMSNSPGASNTTGMVMAMKEIRLELDEAKFAAIIMELDILHRCISPFIIDFYGAFFQEGAVYICMEFMDGGSIDKLYMDGIPEGVLRKITLSTVMGLKVLKDDHNIIHRDVKPTNILVNSRGQIKICDFGVSGNLVASIAKTNIGCQSYMAPERIASGGIAQAGANPGGGTYSVQSDIWSLGLSIVECAMGQYPYPPETYNNIFSQLSASDNLSKSMKSNLLTIIGHRGWRSAQSTHGGFLRRSKRFCPWLLKQNPETQTYICTAATACLACTSTQTANYIRG